MILLSILCLLYYLLVTGNTVCIVSKSNTLLCIILFSVGAIFNYIIMNTVYYIICIHTMAVWTLLWCINMSHSATLQRKTISGFPRSSETTPHWYVHGFYPTLHLYMLGFYCNSLLLFLDVF